MNIAQKLYYSFPFQLLLLHVKKHHILLIFWILLLGLIFKLFMRKFGIPFLFLDPEYLGKVNFWSFFLLGGALGGFLLTWNITTYILHSFRFPFLATLEKPFVNFCLNNSIIPIIFLIVYILQIITFQSKSEFQIGREIILQLLGLFTGLLLILGIAISYFYSMNKNIFQIS